MKREYRIDEADKKLIVLASTESSFTFKEIKETIKRLEKDSKDRRDLIQRIANRLKELKINRIMIVKHRNEHKELAILEEREKLEQQKNFYSDELKNISEDLEELKPYLKIIKDIK